MDYTYLAHPGHIHYINPGNPLFDATVKLIRFRYKSHALQGTILVSPDDPDAYLAYLVKSQITDNRPHKSNENIADEKLLLVCQKEKDYVGTSPAKLIDLQPPVKFAKTIAPPGTVFIEHVQNWSFTNITMPHFTDTDERAKKEVESRTAQLEEAFSQIIFTLTEEINQLQHKILIGEAKKVEDKIAKKQSAIEELKRKKAERLLKLQQMQQLNLKPPDILGCAYVVPLTQVEYKSHFGMSRDDQVEAIAMQQAMQYERDNGWTPIDVSSENAGYDIRSAGPDDLKRYIEVKGRAADGGVMLSENEMNRLEQLGDSAWLYIVVHCKSHPQLYRINNPAINLKFELKSKGVQYFVDMNEWKGKAQ